MLISHKLNYKHRDLLKQKKSNPVSNLRRKRCSPKKLYRPNWRKLIRKGILR